MRKDASLCKLNLLAELSYGLNVCGVDDSGQGVDDNLLPHTVDGPSVDLLDKFPPDQSRLR
ncbi:MAG: hypothetical protein IJ584_05115 [Bacteroidales bacterium]|nr:hypothetical protein [Bacteroidales bacterium]